MIKAYSLPYYCTHLCDIAFDDVMNWDKLLLERGFEQVIPITDKDTSTECFVGKGDGKIFVIFRASRERHDWVKTNFQTTFARTRFGPVHKGFLTSVISVIDRIESSIYQIADDGDELYIAGHSLGGALAQITALMLNDASIEINNVFTFGQPRCMSRKAARLYNNELGDITIRFGVAGDLITLIPFNIVPPDLRYKHAGEHHFFTLDSKLIINPTGVRVYGDWLKDMVNEITKRELFKFEDHDLDLYRENMTANRGKLGS